MNQPEIFESETVTYALRVLDKLLADNVSRQLYAKEIKLLFDLIGYTSPPPVIIKTGERAK